MCDCLHDPRIPRDISVVAAAALLAMIWVSLTRLETRTKESNCCASVWDRNLGRGMKVKVGLCSAEVPRCLRGGCSIARLLPL